MQSGKLRFRIEIQKSTPIFDDYNDPVPNWSTIDTKWGDIITLDGSEVWHAGYIQLLNTHMIVMRYNPELTTEMRLKFRGRIFNIKSILHVNERGKETRISVVESTRNE